MRTSGPREATAVKTSELVEFRTVLTAGEVARGFRAALAAVSPRVQFRRIDPSANPLDEVDEMAIFGVVATFDAMISSWAVQLFLFDHGDYRDARLVVLGTSGIARVLTSAKTTFSRAAGRINATRVVDALTAADPSLRALS